MQRWQQIAIGALLLALGMAFGLWARADFAKGAWPTADATVASREQRFIAHGTAMFVTGRFTVEGAPRTFTAQWGVNTFEGGRWVPPADLPAVGATVPVRYNPASPGEVALGPDAPWWSRAFPVAAAVLLLAGGVAMLLASDGRVRR